MLIPEKPNVIGLLSLLLEPHLGLVFFLSLASRAFTLLLLLILRVSPALWAHESLRLAFYLLVSSPQALTAKGTAGSSITSRWEKGGGVSFLLWPRRRSRARGAYLICTECPHSTRDLLWVSLACLNTWDKVALWCPRPWRGLCNSVVSSMECLKHQGNLSFNSWCLAPTPDDVNAIARIHDSLTFLGTT